MPAAGAAFPAAEGAEGVCELVGVIDGALADAGLADFADNAV